MNAYLRAAKKHPALMVMAQEQLEKRKVQSKSERPGKPEKPAKPGKPKMLNKDGTTG